MTKQSVPGLWGYGVVTREELTAGGLSDAGVRALVRRGSLQQVARGVYVRAATAAKAGQDRAGQDRAAEAQRAAAALARLGPEAAASHWTAASIHGLDVLGREPAGRVAVTRPRSGTGSRSSQRGISVHAAALPGRHVTLQQGVRVTSVARTVVDLARALPVRDGVVTADSALHAGRTSKRELERVLADCRRWPGLDRARQVVAFSDARPESVLESVSRVVFAEQELPPPDLQVWVGSDDWVIGRVDFLWREFATIAEADGTVKYANPSRALTQLQRDARLREAGFEVVHFTWQEIMQVPAEVAAAIREAFRRGRRA
ncbi:MAG: type IV toxin-antitoxin system AbiEi family antitoxin domain-containing protein [Nocardiopsaceae bacterium]|nr:type IV toxin-antitoxin system AbiEi family antitoxin domain-containing protein [Nocardiopsaceae bacterium]